MKVISQLADSTTRATIYLDDDATYTFEALCTDADQALDPATQTEVLVRDHELTLSEAIKKMTLFFVAEWEGCNQGVYDAIDCNVKIVA